MSKQDPIDLSIKIKEAAGIVARTKAGKPTDADKKILADYCVPGQDESLENYQLAAEKYLSRLKDYRENQLSVLLDNGMLFDFQGDNSAAPNDLLRGNLFAPIAKGKRKLLNRKKIGASPDGVVDFYYSGAQLDQADLDTLLVVLRVLSDGTKTGNTSKIADENGRVEYTRVRFSRYGFLKEMGRNTGARSYEWLDDSLRRLSGELSMQIHGKGKIDGPIIGKRLLDEESGDMMVDINQDFSTLFKGDQFAFINMQERLALPSGFAKWLHGFVMTHTGESYRTAEQLMESSGISTKRTRDFMRVQGTPAFVKLQDMGVIKDLEVKGQLYRWRR